MDSTLKIMALLRANYKYTVCLEKFTKRMQVIFKL